MNDKKSIGEKVRALGLAQSSTYEEAKRYLLPGGVADQIASMQASLKPFESLRQQLDAIANPFRDIQASLAASDASRSFRETAAKLGGLDAIYQSVTGANMASALEEMKRNMGLSQAVELSSMMGSYQQERRKLLEQLLPQPDSAMAEYFNEYSSGIKAAAIKAAAAQSAQWLSSSKAITAEIERFINPQGVASLRAYWERMTQVDVGFAAEPTPTEYDRRTEVGSEVVTLVQGVAKEISSAQTQQEAADRIVLAIEGIKEPLYQKLLLSIFYPFLLAMLFSYANPYVDFHVKKSLEGASTQSANKQVKEAAREAVGDLRLLQDYRFVTAHSLAVRTEPKARGQAVGQIRRGQTVLVLDKERDFTLVTWRSEDGNIEVKGWVFSRYLNRFQ